MTPLSHIHPAPRSRSPRRWRRTGVTTSVTVSLLFGLSALIPVAIHHSPLRDRLLNQPLSHQGLEATSRASSGGWLTGFEFHDVEFHATDGSIIGQIKTLRTGQSLLDHLLSSRPSTELRIIQPHVDIYLQDNMPPDNRWDLPPNDLFLSITEGTLRLHVPWRDTPILDVEDVDLQAAVTRQHNQCWLTIERTQLLQNSALNHEDTEQNLALIAPLLARTTDLTGRLSVELDSIRVPLGKSMSDTQVLLQGAATIHSLQAQLDPTWSRPLAGLASLAGNASVPDQLQLVSNSTIRFRVTPSGIHHDGCSLMLPQIGHGMVVRTSGILQLDEQLDVDLQIQIPSPEDSPPRAADSLNQLTVRPFDLKVTGTVSAPQLAGPQGQPLLANLVQQALSSPTPATPADVGSSIRRIIQAGATKDPTQRKQRLTRSIFQLIQAAGSRQP